MALFFFFFFQAEDGIRDTSVTGVQTCALPILCRGGRRGRADGRPRRAQAPAGRARGRSEIGRAAWRGRGGSSVVAAGRKKKKGNTRIEQRRRTSGDRRARPA